MTYKEIADLDSEIEACDAEYAVILVEFNKAMAYLIRMPRKPTEKSLQRGIDLIRKKEPYDGKIRQLVDDSQRILDRFVTSRSKLEMNRIKLNLIRRSVAVQLFSSRLELAAQILPRKIRVEAFEPAFNDEKASYLADRMRFTGDWERKWLAFCFGFHIVLMIGQCFWAWLSEPIKRLLLKFLPDMVRSYFSN